MARTARIGRRGERKARAQTVAQMPFQRVHNPFPPIELLDPPSLQRIDDAAMTILEDVGMDFLHEEALAILREAGADIEPGSQRVRMDRHLVRAHVAQAPSTFELFARNPEHTVGFGGREVLFALMASAPNCSDLENPRHPGTFDDFQRFVRLGQALNAVHLMGGYPVEPVDLPAGTRHLDCTRAFITLSDKAVNVYSLGRQRVLDCIEVIKRGYGLDDTGFAARPWLTTVINTSSPLRLDGPMIEGMIELGRRHQVCIVTPFTLAGAMAPATIAGALAQQHAEALAAIAFYQMIQPGAPVVYGGFTSNVDMKSGAPAFGTPEYFRAVLISGQLARKYGLPFRTSNVNAANSVGAQSSYESLFSLWAAVMGGGNLVKHGLGWLEGGLTCNLEKIVVDADLIQMIRTMMQPVPTDADALGLEAVREVGPGGHYFGAAHTLARYDTTFYAPMVSDWRNFESWQEAGAPDTARHAQERARELLEASAPPVIDPARVEAMDAFIARRKQEGGVAL